MKLLCGNGSAVSLLVCAMLFGLSFSIEAQTRKILRVGFLDVSTASGSSVLVNTFREELKKLGWIEGENIAIEYRFAGQQNQRLANLAAELIGLRVDVIVATSGPAAAAAKKATTAIPIVMAVSSDPVAEGLITNLARPGGNVTGNSGLAPELNTKRLEILKDTLPKLARVGVLTSAGRGIARDLQLKEFRSAASALTLKLEEIETQLDSTGLENAFQAATGKKVNAITTIASRSFFAERKRIIQLADKYRFPAIYWQKEFAYEGGLMSYGTDVADLFRRAAVYVDKILKGSKPAELPVQQATKFVFVINLKTAKQLELTIPVRVVERANQIIK